MDARTVEPSVWRFTTRIGSFLCDAQNVVLLVPALWLVVFWSIVLRARLRIGAWPRFFDLFSDVDTSLDPAVFPIHRSAILLGAPIAAYAIVLGTILIGLAVLFQRHRVSATAAGLFIASVSLIFATVFMDVGGFFRWFAH